MIAKLFFVLDSFSLIQKFGDCSWHFDIRRFVSGNKLLVIINLKLKGFWQTLKTSVTFLIASVHPWLRYVQVIGEEVWRKHKEKFFPRTFCVETCESLTSYLITDTRAHGMKWNLWRYNFFLLASSDFFFGNKVFVLNSWCKAWSSVNLLPFSQNYSSLYLLQNI